MAKSSEVITRNMHDTITELLKARQQRYTSLRRTLIDILSREANPLTIQDLQRAAKGVALSSLYRNLTILEECQIVSRVVTAKGWALFELAETFSEHHHHMVCAQCGMVRDIVVPESIERGLDQQLAKLVKIEGFAFERHRLDLIGTCRKCT